LQEFKDIYVQNIKPVYRGKQTDVKDAFNAYIIFLLPYDYNPDLMISTTACYYSTPAFYHKMFKEFMSYFIRSAKSITVLDFSSHIGNDSYMFCKMFKHVIVNEIVPEYLNVLKHNFNILKVDNYSIWDNKTIPDVVYFDPPYANFKNGDYFYDKPLKEYIDEFTKINPKCIIMIKHAEELKYVTHTFNIYRNYYPGMYERRPSIFSRVSFIGPIVKHLPSPNKIFKASKGPDYKPIREVFSKLGYD
jgi:hypothetical protein